MGAQVLDALWRRLGRSVQLCPAAVPRGWQAQAGTQCSLAWGALEVGRRGDTARGPVCSTLSHRTWSGSMPTSASWWSSALP